jgi:hypothetical protein
MAPRWTCALTVALAVTAVTRPGTPAELKEFRVRLGASQHAQSLQRALVRASDRLERPQCQKLFTDFKDGAGRPLQEKLDGLGLSGADFLRYVGFYEGYGQPRCGNASVMAFTQPGSLAVRVCPQLGRQPENEVDVVLIHEMLHSLGLGENPPSTFEITEQVRKRCGGAAEDFRVRAATR